MTTQDSHQVKPLVTPGTIGNTMLSAPKKNGPEVPTSTAINSLKSVKNMQMERTVVECGTA